MREIKFRAWDGKSIRYDVTGFEHGKSNEMAGIFIDGDFYRINGDFKNEAAAIVMQYTGLKDKNGFEIYEGDIVEFVGSNGCAPSSHPYGGECRDWLGQKIVIVYNSSFFHGRHVEGYEPNKEYPHNCILSGWEILKPYDLWNYAGWTKVIGNIYENPKVLESK